MIKRILNFFRKNKCRICKKATIVKSGKFLVKNFELELSQSMYCKSCAETYLNKNSTICKACGEPIIPGTPVGGLARSRPKEPNYSLVHYTDDCSFPGSYVGVWGEGKVVQPDS